MKIHRVLPLIISASPLIVANSIPRSSTLSNVVDLGYAKYQGTFVQDKETGSTNTQFLGIRFAAPPIGISSSRSEDFILLMRHLAYLL